MTAGSTTAAAVRAVFTAGMILMASVITCASALAGLWSFAIAEGPGDVLKTAAVLIVIVLLALVAVLAQLKWANHGPDAGAIARRSLLVCAGPGAAILFAALVAD
ncbi:MAG: hypothetical protein ACRDTF_05170 [Pseudonocardiaceae bacterium]